MARIAVYLTGGIATYKAVSVVRNLQKLGHQVRVVMTKNAEKFVSSQTLAALTKEEVLDDLWGKENEAKIPHIELADWSELALVVPATADFLAKMAWGLADDAASTTILASNCPKIVVPAMNSHMLANPAVKRNLTQLKADGVVILEPKVGMLAEGYQGRGRMPEPDEITKFVCDSLSTPNTLQGKRVIVTAGGTREAVDPVRYLGNRSSGKMGIAIADEFAKAGAQVDLVVGNIDIAVPNNELIKIHQVSSTEDMLNQVEQLFDACDCLVMVAAPADYKIKNNFNQKIKKKPGQTNLILELTQTPDILKTMGKKKDRQIVVGFAAETENLLVNAQTKLERKHVDMIVANDVSTGVFGSDKNQVYILQKGLEPVSWPEMTKKEIAKRLVSLISEKMK
ncbi:bifunctional phosphopantothenoylcysteine decarboxylase/phosphopantothenate--cysteine ligase CoaBC [Lactobacillus mulieris]|jgi:phosphopantothenoylcysteine decarboxylase/phosphopantothenate--cysteine ligase|uniref:Coenzyme A biosynthesis bifunctional protein CoaBC n=1 Tax=Lactobacillus mulieris TaxID=2508708 RepID=A0AAP3GVS2_9LACO|nr:MULTISPECIES: bifunctional phosphopantothenoylcysteine decarboxylase/phosphopantothenate--cysteine ligase CoaBC [Lactobacillus]EFH29439.1 phosphopantothenoylcysteine decarboxylase/phosphopantothenate--cysteine ligase [Lactobacillus jensenii JV-V16]KAA9244563.1 bifunctional phosphopantothenoylcysteine decarboxylase/phosphopantothenate--cysteine ligase CoaBC [Lactobacillus jensenii]MCW8093748.1 bifunctional phosphopantothenoylcysteine decarboxylase/phosphopantothenate--cysteine ligase CoaBC [La